MNWTYRRDSITYDPQTREQGWTYAIVNVLGEVVATTPSQKHARLIAGLLGRNTELRALLSDVTVTTYANDAGKTVVKVPKGWIEGRDAVLDRKQAASAEEGSSDE